MPAPRICLLLVTVLALFGWGLVMSGQSASAPLAKKIDKPKPAAAKSVEPKLNRQQQRILFTKTQLGHVETMMICYAGLDNDDQFPVAKGQKLLVALTKKHDLQNDGYFADPVFEDPDSVKDAWRRPFHYEWPNTKVKKAKKPAIWSYGPNGINENGKGDDIRNW